MVQLYAALLSGPLLLGFAAQSAPSAESTTSPQTETPAPPSESESAINYDRNERMLLDVKVNQHTDAIFMVDTGSERTVVSDALAKRLSLPSDGRVTISGVAGTANVATARVDTLGFDKVSISNLVAPILQRDHLGADGLLGVDSLQKKSVLFDFDKRQMHVREPRRALTARASNPDEIVVVGKRLNGRLIFTNATIEGVDVTVVVDSGAQYSIGNPALLARLTSKRKIVDPAFTTLHSVTGQTMTATVARAKRLYIGALLLSEVPVAYASSPAFKTLGLDNKPALLLGMNTMRAFRQVEVDFVNRRVRFVTPGGARLGDERRYADGCGAQCGQAMPAS